MSELVVLKEITSELPFTMQAQLQQLPADVQREFLREFEGRKRHVSLAYVLQIMFSAPYAYFNEWGKQILYWFTWGGLGIWWFINLFRLPAKVKRYNTKLADEILGRLMLRSYNPQTGRLKRPSESMPEKPREFTVSYDPSRLTIENLKPGYMVDYRIKTWKAVNENQFDWDNGLTEKEFKLVIESEIDRMFVYLRKESGYLEVLETKQINIHAIDPLLEREILENKQPMNRLNYNGLPYYRENVKKGWVFNIPGDERPRRVTAWEYFNEQRDLVIRIELYGTAEFKTTIGKIISPSLFTDILPVEDY